MTKQSILRFCANTNHPCSNELKYFSKIMLNGYPHVLELENFFLPGYYRYFAPTALTLEFLRGAVSVHRRGGGSFPALRRVQVF
jgi:hypothetical protein